MVVILLHAARCQWQDSQNEGEWVEIETLSLRFELGAIIRSSSKSDNEGVFSTLILSILNHFIFS